MRQIALCYNKFMDWYYFIKINKKSVTSQNVKPRNERPPNPDFRSSGNYKATLEEYLENYKEDNVVLMKFYD